MLLALLLVLGGCATVPPITTVPSTSCDARMVDHNRRVCIEQGKGFLTPGAPGSCGSCVETIPMPSQLR